MSLTISALNADKPREFMGGTYPSRVQVDNDATVEGSLNFNDANGRALCQLLRIQYDPMDASCCDLIPMAVARRAYTRARSTFERKAPGVVEARNELQAFAFDVAQKAMGSGPGGDVTVAARFIPGKMLDLDGLARRLEAFGAFIMDACDLGATHIQLS